MSTATRTVPRSAPSSATVVEARPLPACMVTLLFCDVERFTEMTERLGDHGALLVMHRYHDMIRAQLARHGGEVVEVRGDGSLLAFDNPERGVRCAVAIQRELERIHPCREPMRVRMGLHTGLALRDSGAYFGRTVIASARISELAGGGEILVSRRIRALLRDSDLRFGAGREVHLKGLREPQHVFELRWREPRAAGSGVVASTAGPHPRSVVRRLPLPVPAGVGGATAGPCMYRSRSVAPEPTRL